MGSLPKAITTGSLQDIVVHIPSDGSSEAVIASAVSVARLFAARLDAVISIEHGDKGNGDIAGVSVLQTVAAFEHAMKAAALTLLHFETAARDAGIVYGTQVISERADTIDQILLHASRLYDLSIIAQPQLSPSGRLFPKAMLFDSGGPIILIPRGYVAPFALDRITLCWDGGRCASRAVHDVMPLLPHARAIDVIAVNEGRDFVDPSSDVLASHLARRHLNVQVTQIKSDHADIHRNILDVALDAGSNLIVMGGYGHSKAGRFVLGGVTRDALLSMTIPTFMSF